MNALSAETEAIMIFSNVNAWNRFVYLVNGEVVTSFDPVSPYWRQGSTPIGSSRKCAPQDSTPAPILRALITTSAHLDSRDCYSSPPVSPASS